MNTKHCLQHISLNILDYCKYTNNIMQRGANSQLHLPASIRLQMPARSF